MKLTTQSRYGVRGIFDVAYHAGPSPVQIGDTARRQRLSVRYLEQIFQKLKKSSLLGSKRGPGGGYFLLKDPSDVTVYDIIVSTEGPIELVFCVAENGDIATVASCERAGHCVARPMWKEMGEAIADVFRQVTIGDMCVRAEAMGIKRDGS